MNIHERVLYNRGLRTIKKALRTAQDNDLLVEEPLFIEENLFKFYSFTPTKPITVSVNKRIINNPVSLLLGDPCGNLYICYEGMEAIFPPKTISQLAIGLLEV